MSDRDPGNGRLGYPVNRADAPEEDGASGDSPSSDTLSSDLRSEPSATMPASEGPPGSGLFSVEGRPAPGLYWLSWLLALAGIALLVIGIPASGQGQTLAGLLLLGGLAVLASSFATAAGYQVLARASRPPDAYRGPSPLIAFGFVVTSASVLGALLGAVGLTGQGSTSGFLVSLLIVGGMYLLAILLLVVRTGALSWAEMGWPRGGFTLSRLLADTGYAFVVMLPTLLVVLVFGSIVGGALEVEAPQVVPSARTSIEALIVVLGAVIIAPIGEELFFRGYVISAWQRDLGPRTALIRASFLFAIVHILNVTVEPGNAVVGVKQAILQFAVILPLAFVLGWLFQRRGIVSAIVGHITYNGLVLGLAFLAARAGAG